MKAATAAVQLRSFDGGVRIATRHCRPDRLAFWDDPDRDTRRIARGAGLSYAAASFSADAISTDHRSFDRILGFDAAGKTLEVEAGIALGKVYEFLAPRGFYLAVQPGHPSITIGGCIATDVHGKHQARDGTFEGHVRSLRLFHPDHGVLELSREQEPSLFELTCGGYGLTGDILSAKLAVVQLAAPRVLVTTTPLPDIRALPEALASASARADQLYSWHDFTARGDRFGHGYLIEGRWVTDRATEVHRPRPWHSRLDADNRGAFRLGCFNRLTTRPFNALYQRLLRRQSAPQQLELFDFLFPVHDKEVYFKLFGRRGFHELQVLVPVAAFPEFLQRLRAAIERLRLPVTLASAKLFRGERRLLRFTGDGICLAIDFPRSRRSAAFATAVDAMLPGLGGWPNLIKDSRLPLATVRATYPQYEQFCERLHAFDPRRLYRSEMSERLGL
ncbi:MAG TPA: FAD-binding oxidoreductase [Planctomycetota bacterium]|nr:FAD-binding oxidoreductase [Planctomycetota bacterium]